MKRLLIVAAAAVMLVAVGIVGTLGIQQLGDDDNSADGYVNSVEASRSSESPASETDEAASDEEPNVSSITPDEPEIKGKYDHSCDYLLGEALGDNWFVADATLYNTGNIGTIDRVTATWYLAGGETVTEQREVRNKPGKTKRVGFKLDVTSDQIDQIMSLDGDGVKTCDVRVKTLDTFGEVQDN